MYPQKQMLIMWQLEILTSKPSFCAGQPHSTKTLATPRVSNTSAGARVHSYLCPITATTKISSARRHSNSTYEHNGSPGHKRTNWASSGWKTSFSFLDVTLVTSWAATAFVHPSADGEVSLVVRPARDGREDFTWSRSHSIVAYHNSETGPIPPPNQCVFIRGFRAKRVFFWTRPFRAAAEPILDDPDNHHEDGIQVSRISNAPEYRDPLTGVLDYIAEKCPEDCADDTIAIAHDDDLKLVDNTVCQCQNVGLMPAEGNQ
ncbi:hypothetical protein F5148DRAFT_1157714 [Russula earlei]|uniref:Uncharacterized protein n=1 Tax=Russula earlei TaxID=71964 RepID=A0ACC0UP03_9AGAM|nr:hypothetical protein F5148DRAFT_1157714 [Russula earlei]